MAQANTVVVLDFETTGLSPDNGGRAIEIGAVKLVQGKIVDRFQSLMNPEQYISGFIEDYTGISNAMLADAPPCAEVMHRFIDFIGDENLIAHNASYDKRYLDAELSRISRSYSGNFSCSLLAARRIFQQAPNYKLGTLVKYANIPSTGDFHRALYDSEMTVQVWLAMLSTLKNNYGLSKISFDLIQRLNKIPKKAVHQWLTQLAETC